MDLSELKGIISLMQKSDLSDLEIETQDLKLRLARPGSGSFIAHPQTTTLVPPPAASLPASDPADKSTPEVEGNFFKSPMVGTFYRKPSPDDPAFVEVGKQVNNGDVLCIIEAMKVMNEIKSDISGSIIEILVDDGDSVEFGQPLFKIK